MAMIGNSVIVALILFAAPAHQSSLRTSDAGTAADLTRTIDRLIKDPNVEAACRASDSLDQIDLYVTPKNAEYRPDWIPTKFIHRFVLARRIAAMGARMGTSTSAQDTCTAGTLGMPVHDRKNPSLTGYITCNHVVTRNGCAKGALQYQVAPASATQSTCPGAPDTIIGEWVRSSDVETKAPPFLADAAFVHTTGPQPMDPANRCGLCASSTTPTDPGALKNGDHVMKCGWGSGLTCGRVKGVGCAVKVQYCVLCNFTTFVDQILVEGPFAQRGDSGSVVYTEDGHLVGLLFASDERNFTFVNPMQTVLDQLEVDPDSEPPCKEPKCKLKNPTPAGAVLDPCVGNP
jgi:hypothetical protein